MRARMEAVLSFSGTAADSFSGIGAALELLEEQLRISRFWTFGALSKVHSSQRMREGLWKAVEKI